MSFFHREKDIWILVHGDDFVVVARKSGRDYAEDTLRKAYEIKVENAGPEAEDNKEIKILGRIISYSFDGITCEPDPGLIEGVVEDLGLNGAKGVATPGIREEPEIGTKEITERRKSYPASPERLEGLDEAPLTDIGSKGISPWRRA